MRTEQIHIEILNHISHTCKIMCTHKTKKKQQKNDRTSKCQQILPQWSSVDSVRKDC